MKSGEKNKQNKNAEERKGEGESGVFSLGSRGLEVVGTRKNGRAKRRHARGEGAPSTLACLSRPPVLSFTQYFQAPATQAMLFFLVHFCLRRLHYLMIAWRRLP